jgi:hypothetical protein
VEGACLFEREHHRRIARILQALDADLLAAHGCWFGGGTAMVLRYGEYRESVDVDFLVSDREGYRGIRQLLTGAAGVNGITRPDTSLVQSRDLRADQYGLRTQLRVDDAEIKFEVVLEARIAFEPPDLDDAVCGVKTLSALDLAAGKLLANSDRWADDAVFSRDLIDLAMMAPPKPLLQAATAKAAGAYGTSIESDLAKAIEHLQQRRGRLDACRQALKMGTVPTTVLWQRIRVLKPRARP